MSGLGLLSRWLLFGEWRAHPMRALLAVAAIAVGVAMGFAIHLINAAAFNEFSAAIQSLAGQADLQVAGAKPSSTKAIYPRLAQHEGVAVASPVLEVDAALAGKPGALKIVGLDALRAGYVSPDLAGVPAEGPRRRRAGRRRHLPVAGGPGLAGPAHRRTAAAARRHPRCAAARGRPHPARPQRPAPGVMDIGALQWRFNQLGKLSRVDLKLRDGVDRAAFERALAAN
jgi:putative ABC transport system permease protein